MIGSRLTMILAAALALGCASRAAIPGPRQPLTRTRDGAARVAPAPARLAPLSVPMVHRTRLATGLTVEVVPRRELPLVAIVVATYGFTPHDPAMPAGVASLTARVLSRELERMAIGARDRELAAPEVTLTGDGLLISMQVPSSQVVQALTMLSATLRAEDCYPADVELARISHRELAAQSRMVGPFASLAAYAALYGASDRRGAPFFGSASTVEAVQRGHCVAQRTRGLTPGTSTIAIVGDIDPTAALQHVEGTMASWARPPSAVQRLAPPVFPAPAHNVLLVPVRSQEGSVLILERGPGPRDPGFAAFGVLTRLLGGMFGSELNLELRERRGWAYGVSAERAVAADHSTMRIECTVRADRLLGTLEAFEHELARVRDARRIGAAELAAAIAMERATLIDRLETRSGIAYAIGLGFLRGLPLEHLAAVDAELASLDARAVAQVAASFRIGDAPVVMIGPSVLGGRLAAARPGRFAVIVPR